jgi:hypothetical protein
MYRPQRDAKSLKLDIRGHQYHVLTWGQYQKGEPPLVLLHGWMDLAASFQFLVDALSPSRFIIAPDWRGFGDTQGPDVDHYVFVDYVGDLDFLLDHFELNLGCKTFDLLGHSMGGNVAMMYAGIQEARIHKLINLEGFGMPATRASMAKGRLRRWLDELKAFDQQTLGLKAYASLNDVAKRLMKNNPRLKEDFAHWLASQWACPNSKGEWLLKARAAHKVVSAHLYRLDEMQEIFKGITAPTLCVHSSDLQFDGWWKGMYTFDQYQERLQAVAQLRQTQIKESGHMLHHDQPLALAQVIEAFLTERP